MVVDGHGCHTTLHFGLKAKKKNKTKSLACTGYLNSINNPIKQDLLLILVLGQPQNCLNCLHHVLQLLKMLLSTLKRYMRDLVKIYFGQLKIQVKFWIN